MRCALVAQRDGAQLGIEGAILPPPLQRAVLRGEAVAAALQLLLQVFDAERFDDGCADIALERVRVCRALAAGVLYFWLSAFFKGNSYVHLVCLAWVASPPCMLCSCATHLLAAGPVCRVRRSARITGAAAGKVTSVLVSAAFARPSRTSLLSPQPGHMMSLSCPVHLTYATIAFSSQAAAAQTLDSIRQKLAAAGHGATVLRRVKLAEYRGEQLLEASAALVVQDALRV